MSHNAKFDVFLSYNSRDKAVVKEIGERLKAGLNVWLDVSELRPGLPWQEEFEKGMAASGFVVGGRSA